MERLYGPFVDLTKSIQDFHKRDAVASVDLDIKDCWIRSAVDVEVDGSKVGGH